MTNLGNITNCNQNDPWDSLAIECPEYKLRLFTTGFNKQEDEMAYRCCLLVDTGPYTLQRVCQTWSGHSSLAAATVLHLPISTIIHQGFKAQLVRWVQEQYNCSAGAWNRSDFHTWRVISVSSTCKLQCIIIAVVPFSHSHDKLFQLLSLSTFECRESNATYLETLYSVIDSYHIGCAYGIIEKLMSWAGQFLIYVKRHLIVTWNNKYKFGSFTE